MKHFELFSLNTLIIILSAMLLGVVLGKFCPSNIHLQTATFFHNIYVKIHPESQKDTKTIIMERATKDIQTYTGNDIFEEPQKKKNNFIIFIKKIFHKNTQNDTNLDLIIQ